jgi:dUTP pyrophosphatase
MGKQVKVVRCGTSKPTPYLRKHLPIISTAGPRPLALDLGAGNLRNTRFAQSLGWWVLPVDAAGDHGSMKIDLGKDRLPCDNGSIDLFLCNYVIPFMNEEQRAHLISEIQRVATPGAHIIVEMFHAKNGFPYDIKKLVNQLGWAVVKMSKDRFIARNENTIARFKKLSPLGCKLEYITKDSAGADLTSIEEVFLLPGERKLVSTGIAVEFHKSLSMLICPRSGLALKHGVTVLNAPGVVDSDYRGEVKVMLINLGNAPYKVEPGQRIAQALLVKTVQRDWREVNKLNDTVRGTGGFGHTGT